MTDEATARGIKATCQEAACLGVTFIYTPDHERRAAEMLAGLMDGTWDGYESKPCNDPLSAIGRCARCGGRFRCELFGYGP